MSPSFTGIFMGRVVGSGSCSEPEAIEEAMVNAINVGYVLVGGDHTY
jgi:hypothetical protein